MLDWKMKSLFKFVGLVSIFLVCLYEKKTGLIFGRIENSKMKILSIDFEVFGIVQGELDELKLIIYLLSLTIFFIFQVFSSEK